MKYYDLDPLPIVSGDPAELFFDDRVQLVVEDNDTPDDYTDDRVIDAFYCHDCDGVDD